MVLNEETVTGTARASSTAENGSSFTFLGSAATGAKPFYREYGPDLTGLFLGDCGALGIKSAITLQRHAKVVPRADGGPL